MSKCRKAGDHAYYLANKGRINRKNREYYHDNKEKAQAYQRMYRYGITQEKYDILLLECGGACGVCQVSFTAVPHIDHDHTTGKIRGLLCAGCNVGIGHLKEDPRVLKAAIEYLERHSND